MISEESRRKLYSRYRATQAAPELDLSARAPKYADRAYDAYFSELLPPNTASRILDLGCGRGEFMAFLADKGYKSVQGVEFSDDQIEYARQTGITSIVQSDIAGFLQTSSEHWDCITAIDVMEHFTTNEVLSLLTSVAERLSPGGRFIMRSPNAGSPFFGSIRYADLTHETAFTQMSVEQLFRNVGFHKFGVCDSGPRAHGLKSALRLMAWRCLTLAFRLITMIEMGYSEKVFSRNLIAWAEKDT
jgi:cyclopropane fatty-acyl-phospholipid synthase-like methyltransferase